MTGSTTTIVGHSLIPAALWLAGALLIVLLTGCGEPDSDDEEYTWNLDFSTESRYRVLDLPKSAAENLLNSLSGPCPVEGVPTEPCYVSVQPDGRTIYTEVSWWGPAFQ